jgi:hypothetical protein
MIKLINILKEEILDTESFKEFAQKRHDGAEKIADNAKEKGGPAMLTYNHFVVKLPYYKKANEGKFDVEEGIKEYGELLEELKKAGKDVEMGMTEFQKLVGKIEVLGELIIKSK